MKVVLLGYMASGKSTLGKALAEQLKMSFIDLDEELVRVMQMSIPEIFAQKGEIFFRKKETEVLAEVLQRDANIVLSLGGGTPCYGNNIDLIHTHTQHTFYINLSIPNLVARIKGEKQQRPLVANIADEELPEFLGKHLFERAPFYNKAKHIINGNGKDVAATVAEIAGYLV